MEKIHHKMLRIIHQANSSYGDLLECNGSTYNHQRHLWFLLTEIQKSTVSTDPRFMRSFFREREVPYNLRNNAVLFLPPARSTTHGTDSALFLYPLICNQLPSSLKSSKSNAEFKTNLKQLKNIDCSCVIH